MKKKMSVKAILIPTLSLFLICLVVTAILALTNNITAEKIAENEEQSKQDSMSAVMPDAASFGEPVNIDHIIQSIAGAEGAELTPALNGDGGLIGFAISTLKQGYGGQVKVMTGIDLSGTIIAVDVFYNDDETPGLGKNTSGSAFRDQFKGKNASEDIIVSKDNTVGNAQTVDAVTSATISSRAVTGAVNVACQIYRQYTAKEAE